MTGILLSAAAAAGFIALGRWGLRNVEDLVPANASAVRRAKDERSFRRGSRSCFALGILFALFAVLLAVDCITR